jgi:hypothetical protein
MADDMSAAVEAEIIELAERLTAPDRLECLRCYLLRMITEFGCDGSYRWTIRWRDTFAAQPTGLLRQFELQGGSCDCEILLNVFPDYPPVEAPLPCSGVTRPGSARPCDLGWLRRGAA